MWLPPEFLAKVAYIGVYPITKEHFFHKMPKNEADFYARFNRKNVPRTLYIN